MSSFEVGPVTPVGGLLSSSVSMVVFYPPRFSCSAAAFAT